MIPQYSRLAHLVTILEPFPPERFDIRAFYHRSKDTYCAAAVAACDPEFNAQGFLINIGQEYPATPRYRTLSHWRAVCEFFGLTMDQATHLFHSSGYLMNWRKITPGVVAAQIQEFIRRA